MWSPATYQGLTLLPPLAMPAWANSMAKMTSPGLCSRRRIDARQAVGGATADGSQAWILRAQDIAGVEGTDDDLIVEGGFSASCDVKM